MRRLLAALLLVSAAAASAPTIRDVPARGDVLELHQTLCVSAEVLRFIPAALRPHAKMARSVYEGKPHQVCWLRLDDETVVLVFEDGSAGAVPMRAFVDPYI